ncbi:MAG: AtpZ/AtpI family protein [bacterium]|nr:AtpZ/AtpI family protein [bacterium]
MGIELAAAVAGFSLLGYWIDRSFDTSPWGLLICAICGLIGGFYNFIRSSLRALNQPDLHGSESRDDSKQ